MANNREAWKKNARRGDLLVATLGRDLYIGQGRPPRLTRTAGGVNKGSKSRVDMSTQDQRIAQMTFASVYPMYVAKVEKKGRTKKELDQVIEWLTGFQSKTLKELIKANATFETFFRKASLNPSVHLITGVICGFRVEEIKDPLTRQVRYLDKLVDELAKGRKMEKILRGS